MFAVVQYNLVTDPGRQHPTVIRAFPTVERAREFATQFGLKARDFLGLPFGIGIEYPKDAE